MDREKYEYGVQVTICDVVKARRVTNDLSFKPLLRCDERQADTRCKQRKSRYEMFHNHS